MHGIYKSNVSFIDQTMSFEVKHCKIETVVLSRFSFIWTFIVYVMISTAIIKTEPRTRIEMYRELRNLDDHEIDMILDNPQEIFPTIMGKHPENIPFQTMLMMWEITSDHIAEMYKRAITGRFS